MNGVFAQGNWEKELLYGEDKIFCLIKYFNLSLINLWKDSALWGFKKQTESEKILQGHNHDWKGLPVRSIAELLISVALGAVTSMTVDEGVAWFANLLQTLLSIFFKCNSIGAMPQDTKMSIFSLELTQGGKE